MNYPGGKNSVYHKIINLIPPHQTYIELFLGSGAIARYKRPAAVNIFIDIDESVIASFGDADHHAKNGDTAPQFELLCTDSLAWLNGYRFIGDEFIYADPPYILSTRRQHRQIYRYEMDDQQHIDLLTCLASLPCRVMISGYWSKLYSDLLSSWYITSFEAMTRGGQIATEWLWMNYPTPTELHDYRYLGANFRERERIKRKKQRWVDKLRKMDILERQAIAAAIQELEE